MQRLNNWLKVCHRGRESTDLWMALSANREHSVLRIQSIFEKPGVKGLRECKRPAAVSAAREAIDVKRASGTWQCVHAVILSDPMDLCESAVSRDVPYRCLSVGFFPWREIDSSTLFIDATDGAFAEIVHDPIAAVSGRINGPRSHTDTNA